MIHESELPSTSADDPDFLRLVRGFVNHYLQLYESDTVIIVHVDNWFGDRWLGFSGKIVGAAGVRNRTMNNTTLPSPPFRPTRILSARTFSRVADGKFALVSESLAGLHAEKNGGEFWHLHRAGIYCWYSGNTISNTTAALMVYDVTRNGSSGWYIGFDRDLTWRVTRTKNASISECQQIANGCVGDTSTEHRVGNGPADDNRG